MPGLHRAVDVYVDRATAALADVRARAGLADDGTTGRLDDRGARRRVPRGDRDRVGRGGASVDSSARRCGPARGACRVPFGRPATGDGRRYVCPGHVVLTSLEVPDVEPWSHETPRRYRALVTLRDGDGVIASGRCRVGFRRVEVAGSQLLINGDAVVINGVNRHEHPSGHAVGPSRVDDMRADL